MRAKDLVLASLGFLLACGDPGLEQTGSTDVEPSLWTDEGTAGADTEGSTTDGSTTDGSTTDGGTTDGGTEPDGPGLYLLRGDATAWERLPLAEEGDPYAPTVPVRAAFSLHPQRELWVLTGSHAHVLDVDTMRWTGTHLLRSTFPEIVGTAVLSAVDVQESDQDTSVLISSADTTWVYTHHGATGSFQLEQATGYGEDWAGPDAPDPAEVTAAWMSLDNDLGWVDDGDPAATCGAGAAEVGPYLAVLSDAPRVHLYDCGYCFDFYAAVSATDFSVFRLPGAPEPRAVVAAAWTGQVLVMVAD